MLISGYDMYSVDKESLSSSLPSSIDRIHRPLVGIFRRISVVGCCNGLFCIRDTGHHDFSLWNPSTGDCKRVPSPPGDQFQVGYPWNGHEGMGYGFGYDSKTDDYKLVCFISYFNLKQSEDKIYSLRSDSWEQFKRTQDIPWLLSSRSPRYGVFHNGALHWQSSSSSKALIALNMSHMTDELTRGISPRIFKCREVQWHFIY
ncbi:F-box/kelch-repeat protein At3g06240-like [Papaver somniferum]|uniref:F-box/kelch-repeat protein At3g06240-like n=1 Tax=Papaver somniferum TaxID=3469 RepID=UPI000E7015E3|nr:F-box/kelch-repeat protein At3g06240-like [Papaver somniferum]XP_026445967.1 F-box/kelch-repeat protein At3g06240-like [Papaver somniferum]